MNFVNRHRPVEFAGLRAATLDPCGITPLKLRHLAHDRGVVGRRFEIGAVRIGFQADVAALIADLEFVELALAEPGDEELPHA